MRDEAVPHHRLECLCQRRDELRGDGWNDDHHVALASVVAAVAADDTENTHAARLRLANGLYDVRADVALGVSSTDGQHEQRILRGSTTDLEPGDEDRAPALVVGACGQLRDVVDRGVGLDAAQLAE